MPVCEQHHYHRTRKRWHLVCFLVFMALPFFDVMRFDIPRQRFYCFGAELWINEFAIVFFSLMFLMFLVVISSVVYGRVYCGYACPQMIFSELSLALEAWLERKSKKRLAGLSPAARARVSKTAFYAAVALASVFLAFIFISYFVSPRDLLARLLSLDIHTAGGIAGATVTLIAFLDFTLVRLRFCASACPYGYLQGLLCDRNTLLVHYRDPAGDCIECSKCVRVCPMGIDIRESPFQIECVHCGECIDACDGILARLGKPGLIHYVWGESGGIVETERSWFARLGIRDAKRIVVVLVTLFYLSGLFVALSMRRAVLVRLSPERLTLYRVDDAGVVYNTFRVRLANRGTRPARVAFSVEELPGARLGLAQNPLALAPGTTREQQFEISASPFRGSRDVNPFRIVATAEPGGAVDRFDETFLMPAERNTK